MLASTEDLLSYSSYCLKMYLENKREYKLAYNFLQPFSYPLS